MLKEFYFRFLDDVNHKKGVVEIVNALDFVQANEFANQIAIRLANDSINDWCQDTTHYEPIK